MKNNTSFFERLMQVCEIKRIKNVGELARKLGYSSPEKLYRLERDNSNKPSYQIILDLSNLFDDVDLNWLMTGRGDMLKTDADTNVFKLKSDRLIKNQAVPLYNIEASAGIVTLFSDSSETIPVDYIQIPNLPKCDGAIYVTGDSMYPLLKSGDIIMYKQVHNILENIFFGEMYLISFNVEGDEMVTVKYVQKSDKGDEFIKLVSQNKHHNDKDVPIANVSAMALVKASIRINSMS
ncbi:S24 family peptidase [Flavobacterium cerinum]|uniref:Peptidase S24 n=1 Tax=Flavobacterium cerinum TaxID=2502784 RepID=A0ABY5IVL0_9FLAO|nr:S24 family peptidase [Flavobacterium cerinum]UUC45557.1 peptidase S24 [Flavobacterium cerinum]